MNSVLATRGFTLAVFAGVLASGLLAQEPSATPPLAAEDLEGLRSALETQRHEIEALERQAKESEVRLQALRDALRGPASESEPRTESAGAPGFERVSRTQPRPASVASQVPAPPPSQDAPQAILRISDSVYFRFGLQIQPTYEALQDPDGGGYSQNFYLRRARFLLLGSLGHGVSVFMQTDAPRLGYSGVTGVKNINGDWSAVRGIQIS